MHTLVVHNLTVAMTGAVGRLGPKYMAELACRKGVALHLMTLGGWDAKTIQTLAPAHVHTLDPLVITEGYMERFLGSAAQNAANYPVLEQAFPNAKRISYEPEPNSYVFAVPQLCGGNWIEMIQMHRRGEVAGWIVDTAFVRQYRGTDIQMARDPQLFRHYCQLLSDHGVPFMVHLQPARFPKTGKSPITTTNMVELMAFLVGFPYNPLTEMLRGIRGHQETSVTLKFDPAYGFAGQWFVHWLLDRMIAATTRDLTS